MLQTDKGIDISLNDGINLFAQYFPQSNLPLIPLALHTESSTCFWNAALGFTANNFKEINAIKSTLLPFNTNLSHSQKELLLWHQQLSHASISWVQLIMRGHSFLVLEMRLLYTQGLWSSQKVMTLIVLAANVADMSATCRNSTRFCSNLGQMGRCCQHKIKDVGTFCVSLSRHPYFPPKTRPAQVSM